MTFRIVMIGVLLSTLLPILPASLEAAPNDRPGGRPERSLETGVIPGDPPGRGAGARYIVTFQDDVRDPRGLARSLGRDKDLAVTHVYENALKGFAARIPEQAVQGLRRNPRVVSIEPDRPVTLDAQRIPEGVDRVDADLNQVANIDGQRDSVDVDVAVIDTGVDYTHPDLNVVSATDCTGEVTPAGEPLTWDTNGHGTHVAGTIGAVDNGEGVVGVAPGTRIWSFRVLDSAGSGWDSWVICALDAVAEYAKDGASPLGTIEVANMSLGRGGSDSDCTTATRDAFHQASCRAVAAGVTVVVAAGNASRNAANDIPAAYDEVITVSALADSDGKQGGTGGRTWAAADDAFASFSNYGRDVDLAAPGVDILSTWPTYFDNSSGYRRISGTSMASPHVAGAAALFLAGNRGARPAAVKDALRASRERYDIPGDPDGTAEGVLNVADADQQSAGETNEQTDTSKPRVRIVSPDNGDGVRNRVRVKVRAGDRDSGVAMVEVRYCKGSRCNFAKGKRWAKTVQVRTGCGGSDSPGRAPILSSPLPSMGREIGPSRNPQRCKFETNRSLCQGRWNHPL